MRRCPQCPQLCLLLKSPSFTSRVANFADIPLRLSQILKLKPGDVLPIEKPDRIIAHVDGVPVLTSQYGTVNGQYALRVEHLINPILNSLNEEQPK